MKEKTDTKAALLGLVCNRKYILRSLDEDKYRMWYGANLMWVNLYGYCIRNYGEDQYWSSNANKIIGDA